MGTSLRKVSVASSKMMDMLALTGKETACLSYDVHRAFKLFKHMSVNSSMFIID